MPLITVCKNFGLFQDQLCPIGKVNYHYINGRCLYFESQQLNYSDARSNCEEKFNGNGRLFEPTNLSINKKAHKIAMEIYGDSIVYTNVFYTLERVLKVGYLGIWIGVNDLDEEGKYLYDNK